MYAAAIADPAPSEQLPEPPVAELWPECSNAWPDLPSPAETSNATWVTGFGCKGEGKSANYGVPIAPPGVVKPSDFPAAKQQASTPSKLPPPPPPPRRSAGLIPPPVPCTTEQVEDWMRQTFRPLKNMSTKIPPEVGESVLWRGVKIGKNGNPSTKCEYFNGTIRSMQVEPNNELYFYID